MMVKLLDQSWGKVPSTISQRQVMVMLWSAVLLVCLLAGIYLQERSKEWQLRVEQCNHRVTLAEEIVVRDLNRVRSDLHFVARLPEVRRAVQGNSQSMSEVINVFDSFVASQGAYSQIRLIDRFGMELARVDWDGSKSEVTAEGNLQDKSDRYYVTDSLRLGLGQIFTSEFDLNLEKGRIERPLKPVIRFVTPVNQDGMPGNLLVFNYQGGALLNELSSISIPGKTYLIRSDGSFLLGPTRESEWGWLLGNSNRFSNRFTGIEFQSLIESEFPLDSSDGLFFAKRIQLGQENSEGEESQSSLYCLAHVEDFEAFESSRKLLHRLSLVGGIMLVPLALIARFWAAAIDRREIQNNKIAESERQLRRLSAKLVGLQEDERKKISREIHDSLGQQATAINLDLRMLKERFSDSSEITRLIMESDALLKSLHGFATRVRPAELDDLGLKVALESHISEFVSRTGIETELTVQLEGVNVSSSVSTHIFRIVQESLNNIAKHSEATVASVDLGFNAMLNRIQVHISDDGVGITKQGTDGSESSFSQKRLGILGIRERVDLLGGDIELSSTFGKGTRLDIDIPLATDQSERVKE